LLGNPALASIGTRLALGAFPILFVLMLRWTWGKHAFDLASAAINWSTYLNVLLLSGFTLVPPAVARLRLRCSASAIEFGHDVVDRQSVRDHVKLGRWLLALGVVSITILAMTVNRTFGALAAEHGDALRWWFLLFAALALSQIPLALWLGVAQAVGRYGTALVLIAMPRAGGLLLLPCAAAAGFDPGFAIALALALPLAGQALLGVIARRALRDIDPSSLNGAAKVRRVLPSNLVAGLVVLVGTLVTILPVTLVGHALPDEVGTAHVIVSLANALGGVVVAAYFPISLTLGRRLSEPGGLMRYCLRIARGVFVLSLTALLTVAGTALVCVGLSSVCHPAVLWTTSLVLAGVGLRLGVLGTQHVAIYQRQPQLNLLSATMEALGALTIMLLLMPQLGLPALGWGLLAGGALRFVLALSIEVKWLRSS